MKKTLSITLAAVMLLTACFSVFAVMTASAEDIVNLLDLHESTIDVTGGTVERVDNTIVITSETEGVMNVDIWMVGKQFTVQTQQNVNFDYSCTVPVALCYGLAVKDGGMGYPSFGADFYEQLGYTAADLIAVDGCSDMFVPACESKKSVTSLVGYFNWCKNEPEDGISEVKMINIKLSGMGTLTLNDVEMSATEDLNYPTVYMPGETPTTTESTTTATGTETTATGTETTATGTETTATGTETTATGTETTATGTETTATGTETTVTEAPTTVTEAPTTTTGTTVSTTQGEFEKGDINRDQAVDMRDARLLFQYVSGTATLDEQQLQLGDVTGRGVTDMLDARKLFQIAAGN